LVHFTYRWSGKVGIPTLERGNEEKNTLAEIDAEIAAMRQEWELESCMAQ
jgi:hypothetical protein